MPRRKVEAVSNFSKEVREDVRNLQKEMRSEILKLDKGVKAEIKKVKDSLKPKAPKEKKIKEKKPETTIKKPKAENVTKKKEQSPLRTPNYELPDDLLTFAEKRKKEQSQRFFDDKIKSVEREINTLKYYNDKENWKKATAKDKKNFCSTYFIIKDFLNKEESLLSRYGNDAFDKFDKLWGNTIIAEHLEKYYKNYCEDGTKKKIMKENNKEEKKGVDEEVVKGAGDVFVSVFRPYEGKRPALPEGLLKDPDNKDLIKEAEDDIKEAMKSGKRIKTYKALVVYPKNLSDKDFKQAVKDLLLYKLGL